MELRLQTYAPDFPLMLDEIGASWLLRFLALASIWASKARRIFLAVSDLPRIWAFSASSFSLSVCPVRPASAFFGLAVMREITAARRLVPVVNDSSNPLTLRAPF